MLRLFVDSCICVCGGGCGGGVLQCTAMCIVVCLCVLVHVYGAATISRLLKIIGLFCKIKETIFCKRDL